MHKLPLISTIIATYNEEKNIKNIINSIDSLDYPKDRVEIIVVDNNSKDSTREKARSLIDKVYNLANEKKLTNVENFRGAQVNFGASKANGEILFVPDADMTFEKGLFQEIAEKIQQFDALYVPEFVMGKGWFGKIRNFERSFYNQTCIDALRVFKKDIFEQVSGFDEINMPFAPDDWDLTKMIKEITNKLSITKNKIYHHEEWLTLGVYLNKKSKYVPTIEPYIKKWGKDDPDVKKQLGIKYRYLGVFTENGKWKRLLSHPLLSINLFALRVVVGIKYLLNK